MSFDDIDFNAIRALHHLLEARSVTRAARNLGTTQPNMSRALARLREILGDPLFVSTGRALEPTPFALALVPDVQRAFSAMRAVFDPSARRNDDGDAFPLRVAASDYVSLVVLRPWFARDPASRPVTSLRIVSPTVETIGALHRGEVDLALIPPVELEGLAEFVFRPLCKDEYVLVMRRGHPLSRGQVSLARYLASDHIVVENNVPGVSTVQKALIRLESVRRVRVRAPSQLTALTMVAATDLIASLPAGLAKASGLPLVTRALPLEVEPLTIHLVFHPRWTHHARHRSVRESLLALHTKPSRGHRVAEGR